MGLVEGYLGSGKTLFLTFLGKAYPHRPIYANFDLKLNNVRKVAVEDLENLTEGLLLVDEAYLWLESRVSTSAINRYISYMLFQSRKRGFDVFISSQLSSAIDLRFRYLEDLRVYAVGFNPDKEAFRYLFSGWGRLREFRLPLENAKKLFPLYDTMQYPEIAPTVYEPKRYNKEVEKVVRRIMKEYNSPEKLTKLMVRDYMLEKGIFDAMIMEGVHARLKRRKLEEVKPK